MSKSTRRRALGRGLSALIPVESEEHEVHGGAELVDAHAITPNPFQPRQEFDPEEIDGLARSIEAQGLIQPIVVRKKIDGYEIVSGERRVRAMRKLGWENIPAIVKSKVSDREMLELALVENIQRENLNDIEQATAYQRLLQECHLRHEQLSGRVGKSRSTITNTLRLLKLPQQVQKMITDGVLTSGHARALLAVERPADIKRLAARVVAEGLSVRQAEDAVRALKGEKGPKQRKQRKGSAARVELDPDTVQYLEELQYRFGTAVRINGSSERGKVEIHFSSSEDRDRILNLLLPGT